MIVLFLASFFIKKTTKKTTNLPIAPQFEGTLKYDLEFMVDSTKFKIIKFTEEEIENFKEDFNREIKYVIGKSGIYRDGYNKDQMKLIYKYDKEELYVFMESGTVKIIDVEKRYGTMHPLTSSRFVPKIIKLKGSKIINGKECKGLTIDFEMFGKEEYWFEVGKIPLDIQNFKNYNYEYINELISAYGCFPVQMIKLGGNGKGLLKLTLKSVEEGNVEETIFELPKFKKNRKNPFFDIEGIRFMQVK